MGEGQKMLHKTKDIWLKIKQFILQHPCELCLEPTSYKQILCEACTNNLPFIDNCCSVCSLPMDSIQKTSPLVCGRCQKTPPSYDYSHCIFTYSSPIDVWIRDLKDNRNITWANVFAQYLKSHANEQLTQCEHICIIPSKPRKLFQRGFNPTQLITEKLKSNFKARFYYDFFELHKAKEQRNLSAKQRKINLKQSLHLKDKKLKISGHWLILEDVITTGATAERAASLLKKQGANKVGVCALARVMENRYR